MRTSIRNPLMFRVGLRSAGRTISPFKARLKFSFSRGGPSVLGHHVPNSECSSSSFFIYGSEVLFSSGRYLQKQDERCYKRR